MIASPRHTAADLAAWKDLAQLDFLLSQEERISALVQTALAFLAQNRPAYVSVSWGKDSVVAASLTLMQWPETPVVWFRVHPIANPDCVLVRDEFLRQPCDYQEINVSCKAGGGQWHATGTLEWAQRRASETFGLPAVVGLRAAESRTRQMMIGHGGLANRQSLLPIAHWSTADVFAYLSRYDLPVHPAYAMTGGGRWPRNHIRVASLGGRRGTGHGRAEWEREYYGDVVRRLEASAMVATAEAELAALLRHEADCMFAGEINNGAVACSCASGGS